MRKVMLVVGALAARSALLALVGLAAAPALADKGHIWPSPVELAETAQKAILLHNGKEEVLILGVELKAAREAQVLEFIPFPSEPEVSLAEGEPFGAVQRLIREKRLELERARPGKGGAAHAPVELTFSARIGVHDVSVVQVNEPGAFEQWVRAYARAQGSSSRIDLAAVLPVVDDYLRRGYRHFVFDSVNVGPATRLAQPLAYRFRTGRVYYPLKDTNIVGGRGTVELVMILPGSFLHDEAGDAAQRFWTTLRRISDAPSAWHASSSAKVYPREVETVLPGAAALFAETPKLYLQVLEYVGAYRFQDDLLLELADLRPYAHKLESPSDFYDGTRATPFSGLSDDEIQDYCEANPSVLPCVWRAEAIKGSKQE